MRYYLWAELIRKLFRNKSNKFDLKSTDKLLKKIDRQRKKEEKNEM